jgi:hypothetical protein
VHDLPKRAQRWHRSTVCGVHFALAAVHATHALLLTAGDIVAFMMLLRNRVKRSGRSVWPREFAKQLDLTVPGQIEARAASIR